MLLILYYVVIAVSMSDAACVVIGSYRYSLIAVARYQLKGQISIYRCNRKSNAFEYLGTGHYLGGGG